LCYPAPLDNRSDDEVTRQRQIDKLTRVWAQLGFKHYRDGVHILDLNLVTLNEGLIHSRHQAEKHSR
jgi:ssDNA-specific exonuclease RecJ